MGSKKNRKNTPTKKSKGVKSKTSKETKEEGFLSLLPKLVALLAIGIGVYLASKKSNSLDNIALNPETPDVPVGFSDDKPEVEKIKRFTGKLTYDDNGMVTTRPLPEVNFMPASDRSIFEVTNPENLPYVKYLPGPPMKERRERAMGARFINFYKFRITKWFDDGTKEGSFSGSMRPLENAATNTYTTHTFIIRKQDTGEELERITMEENRHLYFIGPSKDDTTTINSDRYKTALKELEHMKKYHAKNGVPWLSHYPRDPPELFLYPTDFVGQKHHIRSFIGYHESQDIQSTKPVDFNITVVSTSPKVLLIQNLLNDYEIDHIIQMGEKVVKRSKVGSASNGFTSSTRTSENGWLKRSQSKLLNNVYYRFADVLRMTDAQLKDDGSGSAENLQFVRYLESQRYDPHHDFGYTGKARQRFSTLLIYLEIPEHGGGTSFPKAFDGQGIQVKPTKGDAVLFYSMLDDGNGDDMSLHAGMPVHKGRKYVCNLWSWDPFI